LFRLCEAMTSQVVAAEPAVIPLLQRFHGVFLHDSTAIKLPDEYAEEWPGCGGDGESSTASSTVEWADGLCTAITSWKDELEQIGAQFTDLSSLSQQGLDEAANDVRKANETLVDDLKSLGAPDTESGQEAKNAIDELATTVEADLSEIEDTVEGISGITGIPAAAVTISSALSSMASASSSTLQTIQDADVKGELEDAFNEADSCSEITGSS